MRPPHRLWCREACGEHAVAWSPRKPLSGLLPRDSAHALALISRDPEDTAADSGDSDAAESASDEEDMPGTDAS